jgi:hypothetical protein
MTSTYDEILDDVGLEPEKESQGETWGWGLLRPPPVPAVVFGAFYGLIAGMVIAYDIVVLVRMAKATFPKLKERTPILGKRG